MLKTDSANNSMAHPAGRPATRRDLLPVFAIAAAILLLHMLTNMRYGFHRDELQFLSDALHLGWGYVAYPPLTPFIERLSMVLFGFSLEGLRCSQFSRRPASSSRPVSSHERSEATALR